MSMIRIKHTEGEIYVRREGIAYVVPQTMAEGASRTRMYICCAGASSGIDIAFHTPAEFEAALAELTK